MKINTIKTMLIGLLVAFSVAVSPVYAAGPNDWSTGSGDGYSYKYNCNGVQDAVTVVFTNYAYGAQDDAFHTSFLAGQCWIGVLFTSSEHQFAIDFDAANASELRDYVEDNSNATIWYRQGSWLRQLP